MFRWKRPYRDWRLYVFYPISVSLAAVTIFAAIGYGLPGNILWLVLLVFGLATIWIWRLAREGIYVSDDGVRVQRVIRSRVLRWDEIDGIDDGIEDRPIPQALGFRVGDRIVRSSVMRMDMILVQHLGPILSRRRYAELISLLQASLRP